MITKGIKISIILIHKQIFKKTLILTNINTENMLEKLKWIKYILIAATFANPLSKPKDCYATNDLYQDSIISSSTQYNISSSVAFIQLPTKFKNKTQKSNVGLSANDIHNISTKGIFDTPAEKKYKQDEKKRVRRLTRPGTDYNSHISSDGKNYGHLDYTQEIKTDKHGNPLSPTGMSSPYHRKNRSQFRQAQIPLDPMKDPYNKPSQFHEWYNGKWILNEKKANKHQLEIQKKKSKQTQRKKTSINNIECPLNNNQINPDNFSLGNLKGPFAQLTTNFPVPSYNIAAKKLPQNYVWCAYKNTSIHKKQHRNCICQQPSFNLKHYDRLQAFHTR
uniref:Uncharacterized protein n=1 Tax=Apophlaea sinclairii TaxID=212746 RepID=A0A1C9CBP0_9FLOR|nr:hypothetical protein Apop_123 [Apophlaea sinclairii]AOM65813.1 hypothetical protein Apop_123 [Apophlaea sinclairii]